MDGNAISRVLVLRPDKIGDMVISLPFFDRLKEQFPRMKISILASPRNVALIAGDPRFERIFLYRKNILKDIGEVRRMRRERFDCVIDMIREDSLTTLYLSQLCAPGKPRIGIGKPTYRRFYDFNVDVELGDEGHIIENTMKLLHAFGVETQALSGYGTPFIGRNEARKAEEFFADLKSRPSPSLFIGYNISSGSPTRIWAQKNSVALIERVLKEAPQAAVIIVCTNNDRERAGSIANKFSDRLHLVPPDLSLIEACAVVSKLDMLISPDTSLLHVARAFRVPVVGLYSGALWNYHSWRPFGQQGGAVIAKNVDNIFDLTVDEVFACFQQVLEQRESAVK